jgi:hypothetical protein
MANALATKTQSDNFALAAAHAHSSTIVGERLRFSKGRFLIGRGDGEPLPAGATFEVHDVQAAWVKFIDGRIVDQRVGYPMPARDELDDIDEAAWPIGPDGKPQDPWSNQRYLYLIDPESGRELTFVTSSVYGRAAVETLASQIAIKRRSAPGAIAVVRPEAGYKPSRSYGAIPAPKFPIVVWSGMEEPASNGDLDDEIPF